MSMGETDFRLLAENSADILCRMSRDMVLHYVSPSSFAVLGWRPEELVGKGPDSCVIPEDMPELLEIARRNLGPDGEDTPMTVRARKKDGSVIWIEINTRHVYDPVTGQAEEAVVVVRDVTGRKLLEEKLAALAMTDGLTGIANRRAFDEALEREWKRTLRHGTQISLLLLDIDQFKLFNDQYGHQVGDDCLRAVAQAALLAVRATDVVARYGGEELVMILPQVDVAGARETAEKVRLAITDTSCRQSGRWGMGDGEYRSGDGAGADRRNDAHAGGIIAGGGPCAVPGKARRKEPGGGRHAAGAADGDCGVRGLDGERR
jgi:diguanylate cyclase (GGDEF)-like protein/PAS domain S-box-containing protein